MSFDLREVTALACALELGGRAQLRPSSRAHYDRAYKALLRAITRLSRGLTS